MPGGDHGRGWDPRLAGGARISESLAGLGRGEPGAQGVVMRLAGGAYAWERAMASATAPVFPSSQLRCWMMRSMRQPSSVRRM